jgi:hypothetical protein
MDCDITGGNTNVPIEIRLLRQSKEINLTEANDLPYGRGRVSRGPTAS